MLNGAWWVTLKSSDLLLSLFRFRIDNTDHIIDVNKGIKPNSARYERINIMCPIYLPSVPLEETERFIIYAVNKEEYDTCRIMTQHPRILAQCDSPYSMRFFTISFRSFSPTPGAIEFHPGKDYYFISTSSKADIHQRVDGMCRDFNMKIVFKVADNLRDSWEAFKKKNSHSDSNRRKQKDINGGKAHKKGRQKDQDTKNSPMPYDFFLHQTKEQDKALFNDIPDFSDANNAKDDGASRYDKNKENSEEVNKKKASDLVKQEASTSKAASSLNGMAKFLTIIILLMVFCNHP